MNINSDIELYSIGVSIVIQQIEIRKYYFYQLK